MSEERRIIYVGMHDGVCAVSSDDGGKTWRQGPVTALPHAAARVAASPVNGQRAWLAAYEAGVYRTDDGGNTWTHVESYPSDYAHSVLADPSAPDGVVVGSEPAALFRSGDGGASWAECKGFQDVPESSNWGFHAPTRDSHVRDLVVSPGDASLLYAGIEVGGVVRSSDGGDSWRQLPGLDDDIHCLHLGADKQQRVYAATASAPYRSNNGGDDWEKINDGLARRYTLHIAAAPDDADLVLVTVSENARRKSPQFYRSTDGGQTWSAKSRAWAKARKPRTWWWPSSGTRNPRNGSTPARTGAGCTPAATGARRGSGCPSPCRRWPWARWRWPGRHNKPSQKFPPP